MSDEHARATTQTLGCTDPGQFKLPKRPGIVLAGAGARGAYEAGYVATLLPHLKRTRPRIIVGTSAGAINAALLASLSDKSLDDMGSGMKRRWETITQEQVLSDTWLSILKAGIQYCAAFAGAPGPRSLLDTTPLAKSLSEPSLIDWDQINKNINGDDSVVDVLGFVATQCISGRTKVFYQTKNPETFAPDDEQAIDYVRTPLSSEYVRASAAIPVLFPPVLLPPAKSGVPLDRSAYHIDGGVRLNAPLRPARTFGADGLIVISTDSSRYGTSASVDARTVPTLLDQVVQIMRGTCADRMIEDMLVILGQNRQIIETARAKLVEQIAPEEGYVPLIFGGPNSAREVGSAASRTIPEILRGLRAFRHLDLALLEFVTRISPMSQPDLLSYVLFEPEFIRAAIAQGVDDASALLKDHPTEEDLWSWESRQADTAFRTRRARKVERAKNQCVNGHTTQGQGDGASQQAMA